MGSPDINDAVAGTRQLDPRDRPPSGWHRIGSGILSMTLEFHCERRPFWLTEIEPLLPLAIDAEPPEDEEVIEDPNTVRRLARLRCGEDLEMTTTYLVGDGWRLRVLDWLEVAVPDHTPSGQAVSVHVTLHHPLLRTAGPVAAAAIAANHLSDLGLKATATRATRLVLASDFLLDPTAAPVERLEAALAPTADGRDYRRGPGFAFAGPGQLRVDFDRDPWCVRWEALSPCSRSPAGPTYAEVGPLPNGRLPERVICDIRWRALDSSCPRAASAVHVATQVTDAAATLWRTTLEHGLPRAVAASNDASARYVRSWIDDVAAAFDPGDAKDPPSRSKNPLTNGTPQ